MASQGPLGIKRIINAWGYSMAGFRACFKHEEALRQETYALIFLIPLALWLGNSGVERALLVGSLLLVPLVELLNSAVEAVVHRFGGQHHKLSGRAKDIASAAVFLSITMAMITWFLVLSPRFL
jgi:diacylglycerol kinase (ATP)